MSATCKRCGETKAVSEFLLAPKTKRGFLLCCKQCERLRTRGRRKGQPEYARAAVLRYKYGITAEVYGQLKEAQGNLCRICRTKPPEKELAVDHCHTYGTIRGLLCQSCNTGLGMFKDDPVLLEEAAVYLRRAKLDKSKLQEEVP